VELLRLTRLLAMHYATATLSMKQTVLSGAHPLFLSSVQVLFHPCLHYA
jgi:hypothetical protein